MKPKTLGIIFVFIILVALTLTIFMKPKGSLAFGHCGEVDEDSDVCFCFDNETLEIDEMGKRVCIEKNMRGET